MKTVTSLKVYGAAALYYPYEETRLRYIPLHLPLKIFLKAATDSTTQSRTLYSWLFATPHCASEVALSLYE